jgi:hypothetical protein
MFKPTKKFKKWLEEKTRALFNPTKNPPIDWPYISWLSYLKAKEENKEENERLIKMCDELKSTVMANVREKKKLREELDSYKRTGPFSMSQKRR